MEQITLMQLRKGNLLKLWVHKWIKYQHRTVHPFKSISTFWLLIFNEGKREQRERHEKHFYSLLRCGNWSISLSLLLYLCPSVPLPLPLFPSFSPSFSNGVLTIPIESVTKSRTLHTHYLPSLLWLSLFKASFVLT